MKNKPSAEGEKGMSQKKMFGLACIETAAIVIAAMLPALCIGMFKLVRDGDASVLGMVLNAFFSHGDGIVLALSVLGAAFVNLLDIGGGKMDSWAGFRKAIWFAFVVVYLLTFSGDLAVVFSDDWCKSPYAAMALMAFSCLILLLSTWWRRHHSEESADGGNPFQTEVSDFAAGFGAYLKKN